MTDTERPRAAEPIRRGYELLEAPHALRHLAAELRDMHKRDEDLIGTAIFLADSLAAQIDRVVGDLLDRIEMLERQRKKDA